MKLKHVLILIMGLFVLVACRSSDPYQPNQLPAEFDYAAGDAPHPVTLNRVTVTILVDDDMVGNARVIPSLADDNLRPGYVYVVVPISLINRGDKNIKASEFRLIDMHQNLYESWQTNVSFGRELTAMPEIIRAGDTIEGDQVFIIPEPALYADLQLRWQSVDYASRIDLSLGDLAVP